MNVNKLLSLLSDLPIEEMAKAECNLNELVDMGKDVNAATVLSALPEKVKTVVDEIIALRLQALKNLVETAIKKHKKSAADLMEIKKEIGISEVENEIVKLLPADIHLLTYQITAKLEVLYELIESKTGFNKSAELGGDEDIILKILTPIERLKECMLTKRDNELKINDQIKKIRENEDADILKLKSADGYDLLDTEIDSFNEAIGFLVEKIKTYKPDKLNENDKTELQGLELAKNELLAQLNLKKKKMTEIDEKYKSQVEILHGEVKVKINTLTCGEIGDEKKEYDDLKVKFKEEVAKLKEKEEQVYGPALGMLKRECDQYYLHIQDSLFNKTVNFDDAGVPVLKLKAIKELIEILDTKKKLSVIYEKFKNSYQVNKKNFNVEVDAKTKDFFNTIESVMFPPGAFQLAVQGFFGAIRPPVWHANVPKQKEVIVSQSLHMKS